MAKILLVDDDPLLIRMYQTKLENDGYTVEFFKFFWKRTRNICKSTRFSIGHTLGWYKCNFHLYFDIFL